MIQYAYQRILHTIIEENRVMFEMKSSKTNDPYQWSAIECYLAIFEQPRLNSIARDESDLMKRFYFLNSLSSRINGFDFHSKKMIAFGWWLWLAAEMCWSKLFFIPNWVSTHWYTNTHLWSEIGASMSDITNYIQLKFMKIFHCVVCSQIVSKWFSQQVCLK